MKAGKDGPMKKNFPGAFKNTTVEVGDNTITATKQGLTVTGPGGKVSKYKPNTGAYDSVKQQYIDAGGESPMNLGSSTGLSGAQSRPKMVKPGSVDIDGNYVTEGGRRTYTPASVGTVLGGTSPNNMKSPKKMAKKSPAKLKAKAGAKKDAMMDRKSAMTMKKGAMKMAKKSANKMNPGFDKLPKDVQAKIMKKKK